MAFLKCGPSMLASSLAGRCKRVIFLDFDGVLHPPRAIAGARPPLTPCEILTGWPTTFRHLNVLKEMLKGHTDVAVVVSSSWRMFMTDEQLGELLEPISSWYGGSIGSPDIDRDVAIRTWTEINAIFDYVVLDDMPKFFPGLEKDWPNLIICDSEFGISDIRVQQKLCEWLNMHAANESRAA